MYEVPEIKFDVLCPWILHRINLGFEATELPACLYVDYGLSRVNTKGYGFVTAHLLH
jgi:hypothetical protein